ncbi:hypothetical protein PPTG_21645 [Phytophthora nicotianae INRA-310]|uniref:Spt20-like SEP domain-containing protein n=3 Tax=Phytophthora nicotianae TaxID=4792 RepID=W2QW61_PHYN3|nr:hypothetical protein PPTG_21645 [Phytophthora nicotianae INRA-310]ETI34398.1 hypothetical protein F443_19063 [Phytophthora nicotianae P1569]ETM34627.1 hypothetical protein L914_18300 [Phytophthora nicotianae]ETN17353.1 hypothetical protein PPTG_21645 [Phytophthora nicotianae INRA-310]
MSGHEHDSGIPVLGRSLSSSDVNHSHNALKLEPKRSPERKSSSSSAKFDKQVAILPVRFQAMTRITPDTTESRSRLKLQQGIENTNVDKDEDTGGSSDDLHRSAGQLSINGDLKDSKTDEKATYAEQPVGLVVALFHDGFVCRHMTKENEGVEGFAQPYDAESSYFLACIDNGRVPEGLPDMIACAHYNGSVLAEIRDYREMRTALCPVSSAFLPASSQLILTDSEVESGCRVWHTLLQPGKSPLPIDFQSSPLLEPPTLQSMFDHFPDVHPSELETLAVDAKRQLLQEEDVFLSSSSTESSSPRDESQGFSYFPAEPLEPHTNEENDDLRSTTTPTTRSRLHSRLESSPPSSLLSPIARKSARSALNGRDDNTPKRCKRQIQTKLKGSKHGRKSEQNGSNTQYESATNFHESDSTFSREMELCRYRRSEQSRRGYRELIAEDTAQITPLPATQLFLSKLKGKRRRPDNELLYGKPAWVTIAHVGRFYRAATRLEREHSRFLHTNARRLMQAEKTSPADTEHVAGSMRYLARQLGDLSRPSDVIAVACARELKVAEDEGRELRASDWMEVEEHSPASKWQAAVALISPESEPKLELHRVGMDKDENFLGHFFELATDTASLIMDYQPTAAAPHFNAFDDDGNLQLQSA